MQQPNYEQQLRILITNNATDLAQQLIDQHKLPYRISDGILLDALKGTDLWLKRFITVDKSMEVMKQDVHKIAKCEYEVLITGETGVGKEVIANAMIGERVGPTVAVNCAGLPETLIESLLFGYKKGSFTGAEHDRQGFFAAARDGVIFLDEVGELPLSVQAKLLRAIQEKKVMRVGANIWEDVNAKCVCATKQNLKAMVKNRMFRDDLFARISTFEIHISSLKERTCDIIPIIESMEGGKKFLQYVENDPNLTLKELDLQFNVRSLQQYVRRFNVLGRINI